VLKQLSSQSTITS